MNARRSFDAGFALACLVTFLALVATGPAAAQPAGPFYETRFGEASDIAAWSAASGQWEVTNSRLVQYSTGPSRIATVHTYQVFDGGAAPVMSADYAIDVYAHIRNTSAAARAGVVFNFSDPGNYHVLLFSAAGDVQLQSVIGGAAIQLASGSFASFGARTWTHIRIVRSHDTTSVQMDGKPVIAGVRQAGLPDGDVGLLSDRTSAWFDDFSVLNADLVPTPYFTLNPGYLEDFSDGFADRWQPASGSWAVVDGEYRNSAVVHTAVSLSAIPDMLNVVWNDRYAHYTVKARMLNRYSGNGNLVGMVIGYLDAQNYHEVVFSPRGAARLNTVNQGIRTTLASGTYTGGGPMKWFDVEVVYIEQERGPTRAYVTANGRPVLDGVVLPWASAKVGFVTHWAPASFDDVRSLAATFQPYVDDFVRELPWPINYGNWEIRDGSLRSLVVSPTEMFGMPVWRDFMDIDFRTWLVNHYSSSGNLVGLAYAVRSDPGLPAEGNYFEVVFSPTGIARMNRVFKGQTTTIATATYQGAGAHRWFNVQLLHRQSYTTVKVNGVTLFDNVYQPDAQYGSLAVLTHWSLAGYDDISIKQAPR